MGSDFCLFSIDILIESAFVFVFNQLYVTYEICKHTIFLTPFTYEHVSDLTCNLFHFFLDVLNDHVLIDFETHIQPTIKILEYLLKGILLNLTSM